MKSRANTTYVNYMDVELEVEFEDNLEKIFFKLHQNTLQGQRSLPNTRLLLGFANKLIESVKAKEVSSDFYSDKRQFKERCEIFVKYFVRDSAVFIPLDTTCDFIRSS